MTSRRKSAIVFVHIVDVETGKKRSCSKNFKNDAWHVSKIVDTTSTNRLQLSRAEHLKVARLSWHGTSRIVCRIDARANRFCPVILERGKSVPVSGAKRTFGFWRHGRLDTKSNAQFGKGGAEIF